MLLQELHILPPMTESRKIVLVHSAAAALLSFSVLFPYFSRKCFWSTGSVNLSSTQYYPLSKRIIPIARTTWPPAQNICIKRYKRTVYPAFLCPLQQRDGDIIML